MNKILKPGLFVLIFTSLLLGMAENNLLDSAIVEMHRLNYDNSLALIQQESKHDFAPIGRLVIQWHRQVGLHGKNFNSKKMMTLWQSVHALYKKKLKESPADFELNFAMALTLGFKSRIYASKKSAFFLLVNGLKSLKYLRRCQKIDRQHSGIQFVQGVFEYYISKYPTFIRYISTMFLSNSGNRQAGIEKINNCAQSEFFLRYEATYILAFIYLYVENDPMMALSNIEILINQFPENPTYHFMNVYALLQQGKIDDGLGAYQNYCSAINPQNPYYQAEFTQRKRFLRALLDTRQGKNKKALRNWLRLIQSYQMELDHLLAIAELETGHLYHQAGEKKKAILHYKKAIDLDNKTVAIDHAKDALKALE